MMATGLTVRKIAKRLGISINTVEAHRYQAMGRTGANTSIQLILAAVRCGAVPVDSLPALDLPVFIEEE